MTKPTPEEARKIIADKITRLQARHDRNDRREAAQLGQVLAAHTRGQIGDQQVINEATKDTP